MKMVSEEIITALKNAVDHGESLESAVTTTVNSGYNPKEVREAANFIGYGVTTYMQSKPEEHLAMPSQKDMFGNIIQKPIQPKIQIQPRPQPLMQRTQQPLQNQSRFQKIQTQQYHIQQNPDAIKQNISSGRILPSTQQYQRPLQPQMQQMQQPQQMQQMRPIGYQPPIEIIKQTQPLPPKLSYTKEIILIIVLLFLLGVLISTIIFRGSILNFIQSFQSG